MNYSLEEIEALIKTKDFWGSITLEFKRSKVMGFKITETGKIVEEPNKSEAAKKFLGTISH